MGYLDKTTITVDAILTKKGRELLAKGSEFFNITQFALADDEIDYNLWDVNHSLGSNYYGQAIEALPLVEAVPDETQVCKYKLVTLPKNIARMPTITVVPTSLTLTTGGQSALISPTTVNFANGNSTYGYTAILSDADVCYINVAPGGEISSQFNPTVADFAGDSTKSVSVVGRRFEIVAKPQPIESKTATITIIGNETGGVKTVTITVNKENLSSNVLEQAVY
jgi:hypothetical protein|tara:strand:+ start:1388 stop:2059 length:672 start_codon:yes stop_codon:yes gene_type:complete